MSNIVGWGHGVIFFVPVAVKRDNTVFVLVLQSACELSSPSN